VKKKLMVLGIVEEWAGCTRVAGHQSMTIDPVEISVEHLVLGEWYVMAFIHAV